VDLTPYSPRVPGLIRFKKIPATPDFTNAFDFEEAIASVFTEYIVDDKGRKSIKATPIYLVDPGQGGLSPLRTLTLLPAEGPAAVDITNAQAGTVAATPQISARMRKNVTSTAGAANADVNAIVFDQTFYSAHVVSSLASPITLTIELRNLQQILAIHMVAPASIATITVSASVDNSNYLQVDSIAAAAQTDLQYTLNNNVLNGAVQAATAAGTGASTVKLNPLAFRFVKIVIGAAGAGVATTTDVAAK